MVFEDSVSVGCRLSHGFSCSSLLVAWDAHVETNESECCKHVKLAADKKSLVAEPCMTNVHRNKRVILQAC